MRSEGNFFHHRLKNGSQSPFIKARELRDIGGYFGISVWNGSAIALGMVLA